MLVAIIVLALATPAQASPPAQEPRWPEGSANAMGEMWAKQRDDAVAMLKRRDRELLLLLAKTDPGSPDDRVPQAVKAQQRAWRPYVEVECEMVGALSPAFSPLQSAKAVQCEANLTEQRLRRVTAAIRCIERIPLARRGASQQECLYQLAPMAVPLK